MLSASIEQLQHRAEQYVGALRNGRIIESKGSVGGGSVPGAEFASIAVAFSAPAPQESARRLRLSQPAIVPYIEEDRVCVDVRTILPEQDQTVIRVLRETFA